ncbi:DUF2169 domain-containing protein [Duganella sp. LX20W]|uniref:DUF2169 domain-containing protein n=1 Tax=Rugamonas brunnea TaxID=2758569 RepID=A0A7W2EWA2_9BURK|nr:DUF2169 domain-containing protein [Rugamonas brunnea]MBA5639784.1 DUF2169 domain-containing protein [Rugamonas brunnea]
MDVVNHTPFPAAAFNAVDQHDQQFQVFVLRQTLSFGSGQLEYAEKQQPLCAADSPFEDGTSAGIRQESDYCPFKPKCDVILHAVARAPNGVEVRDFPVRLAVGRGSGKNLKILIDKTLRVMGERSFKKRIWPLRLLQWVIKWGTLTLVRPNPWKLTRAKKFKSLPLRDEHAYGGQCRINQGERDARWVPKAHRLTAEQLASHPDAGKSGVTMPVAHAMCAANSIGVGFAPHWYLKAALKSMMPAPRIERAGAPITARQFWRLQKPSKKNVKIEPVGLGVRSKLHPERRALLGTASNAFAHTMASLPGDFDFGMWNAASPDQQVDGLTGGDVIELVNLCPTDVPGLHLDKMGYTYLRIHLPEHECFVLLRPDEGPATTRPLVIDTVLIEPEDYAVTLVWRTTMPKEEVAHVVACEFRMRTFSDRDIARIDPEAYREQQAQEVLSAEAGASS